MCEYGGGLSQLRVGRLVKFRANAVSHSARQTSMSWQCFQVRHAFVDYLTLCFVIFGSIFGTIIGCHATEIKNDPRLTFEYKPKEVPPDADCWAGVLLRCGLSRVG